MPSDLLFLSLGVWIGILTIVVDEYLDYRRDKMGEDNAE